MIKKLRDALKETMANKNVTTKDALKSVINRATLDAKEKKVEITDEIVISAITKEIKELNQTIDILTEKNATDSDLYKRSTAQKEFLSAYLPEALSEDEIRAEIAKVIENTEDKRFIMKNVMTALKGKADGALINKLAREMM